MAHVSYVPPAWVMSPMPTGRKQPTATIQECIRGLLSTGMSQDAAAAHLRVTKGTVSGVVFRARKAGAPLLLTARRATKIAEADFRAFGPKHTRRELAAMFGVDLHTIHEAVRRWGVQTIPGKTGGPPKVDQAARRAAYLDALRAGMTPAAAREVSMGSK